MTKFFNIAFLFTIFFKTTTLLANESLDGSLIICSTNLTSEIKIKEKPLTSTDVLKTYFVKDDPVEIVSQNGEVDMKFSSKDIIRVCKKTEIRVDSITHNIESIPSYPIEFSPSDSSFNLCLLEGDCYIVSSKSDIGEKILQTPLCNIELASGKYLVKASDKFVMIYVLDGSCFILDPKTNKKEQILKRKLGLIVPYPGESGVLITSKEFVDGDVVKFSENVNQLEDLKKSVMIVLMDGKPIGVKLITNAP